MAGMIKSIFGLDTQEVMQKRAEDIRKRALQRTKAGDIDPTVAILGESLGNVLGRGLLSRMGYEDPEMARAKENEALQKELNEDLAKLEKGSVAYFNRLAQAALTAEDYQAANAYISLANTKEAQKTKATEKLEKKEEELRKPFTPKIATKEQNTFYESLLNKKGIELGKDDREVAINDLHQQLEVFKDKWKKDQDKNNKNEAWIGDAKAFEMIVDKNIANGTFKQGDKFLGIFGGGDFTYNP